MAEINPLLAEKQKMLADQERRREQEKPVAARQQVPFAKALLAQLERSPKPPAPAQISMSGPPPLRNDHIPSPEPIGGCFSDFRHDDDDNTETDDHDHDDDRDEKETT